MAKAGGPSTEQLLELLKRAASELSAVREEVSRTQKELAAERRLREEAEATLAREQTVGGVKPKMREQLEEVQELYQQSKVQLEETRDELQRSREDLVNEVAAQREMKSAIDKEASAHGRTRTALEAEQAQHLETRAELDQARTELERTHQEFAEDASRHLAEASAAQQRAEQALEVEHQRLADLSESLATSLAEKDALLARVDSLEAARKSERELEETRVTELENNHALVLAREEQRRGEAQAGLSQEKEKHQATAQKFLAEKQKVRDLEANLQEAKTRVGELESATMAAAEAHAKELHEREDGFRAAEARLVQERAAVQAELAPMQQQVEVTKQERFYVERKYEELSRELQLTLEQRDEARRMLENAQAERQRLERALKHR